LNTIGLPWWAAIPAAAALIRTAITFPLFEIPVRKAHIRRAQIRPLEEARMSLIARKSIQQYPLLEPYRRLIHLAWERKKGVDQYSKAYKTEPSRLQGYGGFAVLLTVSEAIRRMCDTRQGLLGLLLGPFEYFIPDYVREAVGLKSLETIKLDPSLTAGPASAAPQPVQPDLAASGLQETAVASSSTDLSSWVEPTFQQGGLAWIPDLTLADPTLTLPFLLSGGFIASIYMSALSSPEVHPPDVPIRLTDTYAATLDSVASDSDALKHKSLIPNFTTGHRIGLTFAVLIFFPAMQMPSALLLYYIANIGVGMFHQRVLSVLYPLRMAPGACKRPIRVSPFRDRSEDVPLA